MIGKLGVKDSVDTNQFSCYNGSTSGGCSQAAQDAKLSTCPALPTAFNRPEHSMATTTSTLVGATTTATASSLPSSSGGVSGNLVGVGLGFLLLAIGTGYWLGGRRKDAGNQAPTGPPAPPRVSSAVSAKPRAVQAPAVSAYKARAPGSWVGMTEASRTSFVSSITTLAGAGDEKLHLPPPVPLATLGTLVLAAPAALAPAGTRDDDETLILATRPGL